MEQGYQGLMQRYMGRRTPPIQEGLAPEPQQAASSESSAATHSTISTASGRRVLSQHH